MSFNRRRLLRAFLASSGCFAISACAGIAPGIPAAAAEKEPGRFRFPQGLASADPQPDATFFEVFVRHAVRATADSDHTVRIFVENLQPDTVYVQAQIS